jgi:hypothetical protein
MSTEGKGIGIYIDIIGSRRIQSRNDIEFHVNALKEFISKNEEYGIFDIWKGLDEFIIISPDWEYAVKSVIKVQEILHPYGQRFVLTPFETVDYTKSIHEMDNKSFVLVSEGMTRLKKAGLLVEIITTADELLLESVSVILNAIFLLKNSFTLNQMEVYCLYKSGMAQKEIAARLNKSQQHISDTLGRIKFEFLRTLEDRLTQIVTDGINKGNHLQ